MILRNLVTVGVLAGFATAASAQDSVTWKTKARVRVDATQESKKTTTATTYPVGSGTASTAEAKNNTSNMALKMARMSFVGEAGPLSLQIQLRADKSVLGDWIDEAWLAHKLTDEVTVSFGKLKAFAGGYDNDYSSFDRYFGSNFTSSPDSGSAISASKLAPANDAGVQVDGKFGDHKVTLQALQGTNAQPTATSTSGGAMTTSVKYQGSFNGMIRPLVDYTMVKSSSKTYNVSGTDFVYDNGIRKIMGVGVEADVAGGLLMLDYNTATTPKYLKRTRTQDLTADKPTNYGESTDTAIVAMVKYPVGEFTPFVKIVSETVKTGDATVSTATNSGTTTSVVKADQKLMTSGLGVEYRPVKNLRYHAVYITKTDTTTTTTDTYKDGAVSGSKKVEVKAPLTQIIFGASASI